jgi:hypothetical protein
VFGAVARLTGCGSTAEVGTLGGAERVCGGGFGKGYFDNESVDELVKPSDDSRGLLLELDK